MSSKIEVAHNLLEKAKSASSERIAIKLAREAHKVCPDYFESAKYLAKLETNYKKKMKILNDGLDREKSRLEKENYFDEESIGKFYLIYETRPYILGLADKVEYLIDKNKIEEAKSVCEEIIRLNEMDNTGTRYILMAIHAYLLDKESMLKLWNKYPENTFSMLFGFVAYYYKQENYEKVDEYLEKINKVNPYLKNYFEGEDDDENILSLGMYAPGKISEIMVYFSENLFLLKDLVGIQNYVLYGEKVLKKSIDNSKVLKKINFKETKTLVNNDLKRIITRAEKDFGIIIPGEEEKYFPQLLYVEYAILFTYEMFHISDYSLERAIAIMIYDLKSYIDNIKYDYTNIVDKEEIEFAKKVEKAFNPYINKEINITEEASNNLKDLFTLPIMCLLRIYKSVGDWRKNSGNDGYFKMLRSYVPYNLTNELYIALDDKYLIKD